MKIPACSFYCGSDSFAHFKSAYADSNVKYAGYSRSLNTVSSDIVSFSSKCAPKKSNSEQALDFGSRIFEMLLRSRGSNVQNFIKQNIKDAELQPADRMPAELPKYTAMVLFKLSDNFKPQNTVLYADLDFNSAQPADYLFSAANIAHEYTHLLQIDEDCSLYKDLSNGDYKYAASIMGMGGGIFRELEGLFNQESADAYKNPQKIKKVFDELYYITLKNALLYPFDYDLGFVSIVNKVIKSKDGTEKFKEDIKKCCIRQAEKEIEAYDTSAAMYKKYCGGLMPPEIDLIKKRYDIIIEQLKS